MEKKFSISWKSSSRKNKQIKFMKNAPSHVRHKMMSAHLSKELRKKYGRRSFPLKKGDSVKIMKGAFDKKTGKVIEIDMARMRIYVEGMQRAKQDGSKVNVPISHSNVMITELDSEDKKRVSSLERNIKAREAKAGGKK